MSRMDKLKTVRDIKKLIANNKLPELDTIQDLFDKSYRGEKNYYMQSLLYSANSKYNPTRVSGLLEDHNSEFLTPKIVYDTLREEIKQVDNLNLDNMQINFKPLLL